MVAGQPSKVNIGIVFTVHGYLLAMLALVKEISVSGLL